MARIGWEHNPPELATTLAEAEAVNPSWNTWPRSPQGRCDSPQWAPLTYMARLQTKAWPNSNYRRMALPLIGGGNTAMHRDNGEPPLTATMVLS